MATGRRRYVAHLESWLGAAGAAAAIALFIAFGGFGREEPHGEPAVPGASERARGGDDEPLRAKGDGAVGGGEGLEAFVVGDDGGHPQRVKAGSTMHARDGLAFAIIGTAAFEYVLIYGVDDDGHVFWFYPEVTGARATSMKAAPGELPDVVRDDAVHAGRLTIHALFSHAPVHTAAAKPPSAESIAMASARGEVSDVSVVVEVVP